MAALPPLLPPSNAAALLYEAPPLPSSPDGLEGERRNRVLINWGQSPEIHNEGSTARDYLARERNWLSWVKLSTTLFVIATALLLQFQFAGGGSEYPVPPFELASDKPLGVLFFVASLAALLAGTAGFFRYSSEMKRKAGFISAGVVTQIVSFGIAALTFAACVLLLIAANGQT